MKNIKEALKIVFFGTPEFASFCLQELFSNGFIIKGVVTAPDRKAGRGKKFKKSAVKNYAEINGFPIYQPENLKSVEFVKDLRKIGADAFVVVAFRMLPKLVWSIPNLGTINLHASLLPNYRGAAPINWVLINGEESTGVTTFLINEQIDTGLILMQKEIFISKTDNMETLSNKLLNIGAQILIKTLLGLKKKLITPVFQKPSGNEKLAFKLTKENTMINWDNSLEQIKNFVRGLSPYPGAWTNLIVNGSSQRIKIFEAEPVFETHPHATNLIVIKGNKIYISHTEGFLNCKEIQIPNKRRMDAKTLLNGYKFPKDSSVL